MGRVGKLEQTVSKLRQCGETITEIANTLSEMFGGTGKADQAEQKPTTPEEKPLALEDVRAILAEKSRKGHTAEIRSLLQKYGADKLSQLDPANYKSLLADVEVLIDAT